MPRLIELIRNIFVARWQYTIPGTEIRFELWFWRWSNKAQVTYDLPEYIVRSEHCRLRVN